MALMAISLAASAAGPRVALDTNLGRIVLELDDAKAPVSTANFLKYAGDGFYAGTVFHRVIPDFMIQGGGYNAGMKEKPTNPPIANEGRNGLRNLRGTVSMARRGDPDSATSQFFINVVDNPRLDYPQPDGYGYAVFGKVVDGMDVVDKIRALPTGSRAGHQNVPLDPVVIEKATILK
ncbi:peptidylprolyl isomerase [Derxia gummosa]|uniref:Peptidyl-prolyl cis-trans isomerase n=1 Tax=Derxia gummosa DSM 723 TaxID=1121388 RepID=A0A9U5GSA8_9BURK|nr:peptidylprolyl isomerase [Derxia gummosa]